eukprot:4257625-Amphidinium_carterae.1
MTCTVTPAGRQIMQQQCHHREPCMHKMSLGWRQRAAEVHILQHFVLGPSPSNIPGLDTWWSAP